MDCNRKTEVTTQNGAVTAEKVDRELLNIFSKHRIGEKSHDGSQRTEIAIRDPRSDTTGGEVNITYREHDNDEPSLEVSGAIAFGSGVTFSIDGPLSDWELAQEVDDHNLLTSLIYEGQSILEVYGPPAKFRSSGIEVERENGEEVLISPTHADI